MRRRALSPKSRFASLTFIIAVIVAVTGCRRMSIETRDCIDTAIVASFEQLNHVDTVGNLSKTLSSEMAKYQDVHWTVVAIKGIDLNASYSWKNGQESQGFNIVIQPDGWVKCKSDGALKYDIIFSDGEMELRDGAIHIKDGTRVAVNGTPYVFAHGSYSRQSR